MSFPGLQQYLAHLYGATQAGTRVWLDAEGCAHGRFFKSTLTSAFQPIRTLETGTVIGYEGFARSQSGSDQGLCLWKLLDHAANDDESVELDRLCRILHSVNFFRQEQAAGGDLYLSVHARLLAAVEGNHGTAFNRILSLLELPQNRIVLQLPVVVEHQGWLVNYVADNYRRNGFRIALNAADAEDALVLVEKIRPEVVKVDTRHTVRDEPVLRLLEKCADQNVRVVFKRVENLSTLEMLKHVATASGQTIYAQGFLWDLPHASLAGSKVRAQKMPAQQDRWIHAGAA